jgi:ATP-dependent Clp protease, protease subunit
VKNWYSIKAKADQKTAEISIYDEIGYWGVTAKQFIGDLKAVDATTIKLAINSPGGAVFDALAIYNALRQHPAAVEVTIMGVAASAASVIAMAGDTIVMPENAFMMIHNPLNMAYGNADDLREMADVLDKIGASLIGIYAKRTGLPDDEIKALLDAETWLNAEEAVTKGFADELQAELKVAAAFDMERLPENVRASIAPPVAEPAPEPQLNNEPQIDPVALSSRIVALAAEAGMAAHADAFILDPAIKAEADAVAAIAEAKEVVAVCAAAKLPEVAAGLIKARLPLASVRQRLMEARAALDRAMPINHHISTPNPAARSGKDIWAKILKSQRQTKE